MIEIKGRYSTAKVFTDQIEESAREQVETLCDMGFTSKSSIRIMPDVHAGAGCTIGTTMTIKDKIVPNLVGVDIGCGMETVKIEEKEIDLQKLDKLIYEKIPSGFQVRQSPHRYYDEINLNELKCREHIDIQRASYSIGTLGGGNHFIEVNRTEEGALYLVIHSGSRHLGKEVASHYQKAGHKELKNSDIPYNLAYVEGRLLEDYLHDMTLVQQYAALNRKAMMNEIIRGMKLDAGETFTTIHNYIDTKEMILRKGAVSSKKGEKLLIPINMRDGSLICCGKGNADWNYSAPHGAGRLMSRKQAKERFSLSRFKEEMQDVYTTSVGRDTLDECPMAYKGIDSIVSNIGPTADIINRIVPIYNFKAGEEKKSWKKR